MLQTIRAAEPRLVPRMLERPGEADDQPWNDSSWDEIAQICAGEPGHTRNLVCDAGSLRVACRDDELRLSLIFEPDGDPTDALIRVITAVAEIRRPELAIAFDPSSAEDDDLLFQGRARLDRIPPIFYFDRTALVPFGGLENVRTRAPGKPRDVPGGLLFVVRATLWSRKTNDDLDREKAFESFFQITSRTPLALATHDHSATDAGDPPWNLVQELGWSDDDDFLSPQTWLGGGDGRWIVGEQGTIMRRDGSRWNVVASNTDEDLFGVVELDATNAWAVGAAGTILHWNGHAWSAVTSPTTKPLTAVWASAADRVFAAGAVGTILGWDGHVWSVMHTDTDVDLMSISGTSDTVWAVGFEGVIVQWNGTQWTRVEAPIRTSFDSVHAVGEDVWIAGGAGAILRWHAGRWTNVDSETDVDLRSISVLDERDIWVAGDNFTLRHWDGTRWTALHDDTKPTASLLRVWRTRDGVWVVGNQLTIVLAIPG